MKSARKHTVDRHHQRPQMKETDYIRDLTVGEFRELITAVLGERHGNKHGTVTGLDGLAELLGCSVSTIKRYYYILRPAIARRGRTIVADADKVLALWAKR